MKACEVLNFVNTRRSQQRKKYSRGHQTSLLLSASQPMVNEEWITFKTYRILSKKIREYM